MQRMQYESTFFKELGFVSMVTNWLFHDRLFVPFCQPLATKDSSESFSIIRTLKCVYEWVKKRVGSEKKPHHSMNKKQTFAIINNSACF